MCQHTRSSPEEYRELLNLFLLAFRDWLCIPLLLEFLASSPTSSVRTLCVINCYTCVRYTGEDTVMYVYSFCY